MERAQKREALKNRMAYFTQTLRSKRVVIDEEVDRGNFQRECLVDPTKALNYEEDVIDPNLDLLLNNPEVYNKVEIGEKRRQLEIVKKKTLDILNSLRELADIKREQRQNQELGRSNANNYAKCLVGAKSDYFV